MGGETADILRSLQSRIRLLERAVFGIAAPPEVHASYLPECLREYESEMEREAIPAMIESAKRNQALAADARNRGPLT